jgi:nitrate/TMAO reductase-like tetraheme cytochrome c subunit
MTCHNKEHGTFCKINPSVVSSIKSNCIDCHMPKQPSMAVALLLPGDIEPTAALIHTHLIKVYPEETKKFIERKNK